MSLSTTYNVKMSYSGNSKFGYYWNGSFLNNSSACHSNIVLTGYAGAEMTNDSNAVDSRSDYLQKRASDGQTWSYYWPSSHLQADAGMHTGWIVTDLYLFSST